MIKFDSDGNVGKFVYPEQVKLDKNLPNGFEFNENDFTLTLNLNKDKRINDMIQNIVEQDIKKEVIKNSIIEEKQRNDREGMEEVLLREDGEGLISSKYIKYQRSDFDFIDLKTQIEENKEKKLIRYFLFRYKNDVSYIRIISDIEKKKDAKGRTIDNTLVDTIKVDLKLR